MTSYLTLRLKHVVELVLLAAGGDNVVDPVSTRPTIPTKLPERAPVLSGPDVAVFNSEASTTVDYHCEHPDRLGIEVEVLRVPAAAKYTISNIGGDYKKRIALTLWAPQQYFGKVPDPERFGGRQDKITMLCRSKTGRSESRATFDLYIIPS